MEKEDLNKLEKEELIDIIIDHYNLLKKRAKDNKEKSNEIENDPLENMMWSCYHAHYSALETHANLLNNIITLKINNKL